MQSFLAKCAALCIVAGGFALTGDIGRLAARGRRLLEARTVPSEAQTREQPAEYSVAPAAPPHADTTQPDPDTATATKPPEQSFAPNAPTPSAKPGVLLLDAPIGRPVAVPAPPANGPDVVELRHVPPGSRVLVWVRRSGFMSRARSIDLVALDLIDPNTGEALEHRHATLSQGNEPTAVHAAPRRVVISQERGTYAGTFPAKAHVEGIVRGGLLRVTPVHGIAGLGREETVGTVVAVDIQHR